MKFIITQRKIEVKDDVKDYAEKKLEKLEKYFSNESNATVTFSELRELKIIEVTVKHNNMYFRAQEKAKDYHEAIDKIVDVLERQIRKHKTKLEKRLKTDAFKDVMPLTETTSYDIVRNKKFDVKPYTVEEAILQMELLGHNFFFFKNADDLDNYAVIYARDNGGYGIINT